jgi:hypothetical protein
MEIIGRNEETPATTGPGHGGRGALPGLRHLFDATHPGGALARGSAGTLRATQGAQRFGMTGLARWWLERVAKRHGESMEFCMSWYSFQMVFIVHMVLDVLFAGFYECLYCFCIF